MIASLAYFQNSSVCDMAHPSCAPTRPDCHAAPLVSGSLVKSAHIDRAASNPSTAKSSPDEWPESLYASVRQPFDYSGILKLTFFLPTSFRRSQQRVSVEPPRCAPY
jgi:hypothetical protein